MTDAKKLAAEMLADTMKALDRDGLERQLRECIYHAQRAQAKVRGQMETLPGERANRAVEGVPEALRYRRVMDQVLLDLVDFEADMEFRIVEMQGVKPSRLKSVV